MNPRGSVAIETSIQGEKLVRCNCCAFITVAQSESADKGLAGKVTRVQDYNRKAAVVIQPPGHGPSLAGARAAVEGGVPMC